MSIMQQLEAAGVPLDNHRSDLYAKVTPESAAIVRAYAFSKLVSVFRDEINGEPWFDIPFAYDPFWETGGGEAINS